MATTKPTVSKLLNFKEWLTLDEAARQFSILVSEEVTEADLLQFAIERRLKLAIRVVVPTPAKRVRIEPIKDMPFRIYVPGLANWTGTPLPEVGVLLADVPKLPQDIVQALSSGALMLEPPGTVFCDDNLLIVDHETVSISGLCELPMIGAEALVIETQFQRLMDDGYFEFGHVDGAFVEQAGVLYQLQSECDVYDRHEGTSAQLAEFEQRIVNENLDSVAADGLRARHERLKRKRAALIASGKIFDQMHWATSDLPEHAAIVVRLSALLEFEQRVNAPRADTSKRLGVREETTYLNIIGACFELMLGKTPSGKGRSVYRHQSNIIDAMLAEFEGKPGMSQSTLDIKVPLARKSIMS